MSNDTRTQLAKAIVAWLKDPASSSQASSPDKQAQLASAANSISDAFSLDDQSSATGAASLQTIYDVFLKTQQKMGAAAPGSTAAASSTSTSAPSSAPTNAPTPEDLAAADAHKTAGNKSMSAKDFGAAIASYTKAIDLNRSPIYYSNRAAAYSQVGQHEKAIEDAREAARIDPKFGKAYSRLGHALFSSGKFDEAVEAYQQGLLVDPDNKLMQTGLETAKSQASKSGSSGSGSAEGAPGSGSQAATRSAGPDAGAGAGAGGFPGMGGGMPDLGSLLNNPMMQQMAQSMMANGGMEQLLNNPMLRGMADRMGSGGGGMPDMSQIQQMMRDPQMMAMARQFMGGMGGGGAAGAGGGAGGQGGSGSGSGRTGDDMFG